MNAGRPFRVLLAIVAVIVCAYPTRASSRDILFPFQGGYIVGDSNSLAFVSDGRLGFALLVGSDNVERRLFSFSTEDSSIIDGMDITPDFSAGGGGAQILPQVSMKVDEPASVVLLYGTDTGLRQRVIGFAFNQTGRLTRLWATTYDAPQILSNGAELTLSGDGSGIFVIYSSSVEGSARCSLDLLDARSGMVLARADLTQSQSAARAVVLDDTHNRVVVLCDQTVLAVRRTTGPLQIDSQINYTGTQRLGFFPLGVAQNGRFLITYASFTQPPGADDGANVYVVYDLEALQSREFHFDSALFPASNQIAFNSAAGLAIDAPIAGYQHSDGGLELIIKPRRSLELYSLNSEGVLTRTMELEVPKASGAIFNGPLLSRSGAMGVVPTVTGRLLSLDTSTGEIVGDKSIGGNAQTSVQLIESRRLLSFTDGTNKLTLVDMNTGPTIEGVKVRGSNTTLTGTNFLAGARVQINGMEVEGATRSPDDPGHIITIGRGKRDFPSGQSFSISVINRDGLASEPFLLMR
jgi:hypothetical protein